MQRHPDLPHHTLVAEPEADTQVVEDVWEAVEAEEDN
jgi:hypothetical protein